MWAGWLCLGMLLLLVVGFAAAAVRRRRRGFRRLERWAAAQGYDLLRVIDPPFLRPGPFFLQHSRNVSVARIVVRTPAGGERIGWVCYFVGLFDGPELSHVRLVWDDEWDRNRPIF